MRNTMTANLSAKGLIRPKVADGVQHVYHQYVIRLTEEFPLNRTSFMEYLKAKGIGSAVHYPIPIHRQPLYARWQNRIPARYRPGLPRSRALPAGAPVT